MQEEIKQFDTESFNKQVEEFMKSFPQVKAESIPDEVWQDVADGIPLVYAYAYRISVKDKAEKMNEANHSRELPLSAERAEPISFTKEEVEAMSPNGIKSNFKRILSSMRKWKF